MSIKVGLIGAGIMMQVVHLPHLKQTKGIEVTALADLNVTLADRVAKAYGIPNVYESANEMVEKEQQLDAVIVVTRKDLHARAAIPALERGIHVFIEKPLESSIADAERMVELAKKNNATLMVGYMKRFDPSVLKLQKLLINKEIGDVLQGNFHDFGGDWTQGALGVDHLEIDFSNHTDPYEFQYERNQGVNTKSTSPMIEETWKDIYDEWIEVWSHDVNLARTFFGEPEEILYVQHQKPRIAIVQFQKGRGLFEVGQSNYDQAPWDEVITFYGSEGRAKLEFPAPLLFRQHTKLTIENAHAKSLPRVPNGESFQRELIHFFRCIRNQTVPLTNGEEAIRDLKLCEAIAKS
jgi:predicted dehydrogenase